MNRFEGRIVIVAGGAAGIGAATAARLGAEGAKVVVADINSDGAKGVADRITAAGGTALALAYDQGEEKSVVDLVARSVEAFGGLDGYYAAAAAMNLPREGDFEVETMQTAIWEKTFRINLTNHAVATREAIPHMLKRGGGSIVYTASDAGFAPLHKPVAYPCSKAGLGALTRHICVHHGKQGIRANCVSPGLIITERLKKVFAEAEAKGIDITDGQRAKINYPRAGTPEDVAALVCFLLSEDAAFINGQTISVNGGAYCRL